MSFWTYITGVIGVSPFGRTGPETRYILDTVLEHMPAVTGSEGDMQYRVTAKHGYNRSSSHNEFGEPLMTHGRYEWGRTQTDYMVVVEASLRDRFFEDTLRELNKWLNRFAKRMDIDDIVVKLDGRSKFDYEPKRIIISDPDPYREMFEYPSWASSGEPAWWEYLVWDNVKNDEYPLLLCHKYYDDPEVDAEVTRRMEYYGRK